MANRWVGITTADGKFLQSHSNGAISFKGDGFGPAMIFRREALGGKKVAFKNLASGLYLATNEASQMGQDADVGDRQTWTETDHGIEGVALLGFNNRYLCLGVMTVSDHSPFVGGDAPDHFYREAFTMYDAINFLRYLEPPADMLPDLPPIMSTVPPVRAKDDEPLVSGFGRLVDGAVQIDKTDDKPQRPLLGRIE